jgi:predicted enzyme related to lactoylglutathione lyase
MNRLVAAILGAVMLTACASASAQPQQENATSLVAAAPTPSLMMVRVYTPDLERSARFYTDVFGMSASPFGGNEMMMMFPSGGAGVVLYRPEANATPMRSGFVVRVESVDAILSRVAAAGGAVARQPFDIPQVHIRGAIINDPDGSSIEIIESTVAR